MTEVNMEYIGLFFQESEVAFVCDCIILLYFSYILRNINWSTAWLCFFEEKPNILERYWDGKKFLSFTIIESKIAAH